MSNNVLIDNQDVNEYLSSKYEEINGYDFYNYIFPDNEIKGQLNYDYSNPNAIYIFKNENGVVNRKTMLKDTFENEFIENIECNEMALCSGLSYRGNYNRLENAQKMHALIFDLDLVGKDEVINLFLRLGNDPKTFRAMPMPTFIVSSGGGLHLYYVLTDPIDLYPNIKLQLKALKYDLTFKLWDYKGTTRLKEIQYQSINQGFRMVGSTNQKYGLDIKAYRTGDKISLDTLNEYVMNDSNRVDINKPFKPSKMTLEQAKSSYPEWYQRVIIDKNKNAKKWDINSKQGYALYEWWLNQKNKAKGGHRYYYLMCLTIYAVKCDVPKEKLEKDMYSIFDYLKGIEHNNTLTEEDLKSALETYDKAYYNYTIKDIEHLSAISIERNKRNGRKQINHLERARAVQKIDYPNKEWINKNGAPTKQEQVQKWKFKNPNGRKIDCINETKLSKMTVYKWW